MSKCIEDIRKDVIDKVSQKLQNKGAFVKDGTGYFPNPKLASPAIHSINTEFGEIIVKEGEKGAFSISPSTSLIQEYWDEYNKDNRNINYFNGDQALLDQENNEYLQKENTYQSQASPETVTKIKSLLNKWGVKIDSLEKYAEEHNLDVEGINGVADLVHKIIAIAEGKEQQALPEEAFHVGFAILQFANPELARKLMSRVHKFNMYDDVFEQYKDTYKNKDGTPDVLKIKEEAVGKLLAEALISRENPSLKDSTLSIKPEYQPKTWWQTILDWISRLYKKSDVKLFQEAANTILNKNIGNVSDIKSKNVLFQLSDKEKTTVDKLEQTDAILKKATKDVNVSDELLLEETPDNWYEVLRNGKWEVVKNRVTDRTKDWYARIFRNKTFNEEQKKYYNLLREYGNDIHGTLQDIGIRYVDPETHKFRDVPIERPSASSIPNDSDFTAYEKLERYFLDLTEGYDKANSLFYIEKQIYTPEKPGTKEEAGTIDLLVLENKDGKFKANIYDWKSMGDREDMPDIAGYKQGAYDIQLGTYKRILRDEYGIDSFGHVRAIPIMMKLAQERRTGDSVLTAVNIGSANPKEIGPDFYKYLPVPILAERTGNEKIDKLLDKLSAAYSKLQGSKVEEEERQLKRERLAALKLTIRIMQTQQDITPLLNAMDLYKNQLRTLLDKYSSIQNLSKEEAEELANEFLDLDDQHNYYTDVSVELKDVLSDNKELYDDIVKEENEIRVNLKQFDEAKLRLVKEIGEKYEIFGLLDAEKIIKGTYKNFKSFDEYGVRAAQLIVRLYNEAEQDAIEESLKTNRELSEIISKINKQGKGFKALLKDGKHELISKLSPEFQKKVEEAIKNGNIEEFLRENISNLSEYVKEIEAEKKAKIERVEKRIVVQEWEKEAKESEIEAIERDYAPFSPAKINRIIKKYANESWYSKEYKELTAPELELYNKIIEINTEAYEAGYIDFLQIEKFVPFIQPDLMNKLAKNGLNIGKLPSILVDSINATDKNYYLYNQVSKEKIKQLPKPFTYQIENPSKELGQAMIQYAEQLAKFKAMSKIDSTIDLILNIESLKEHLVVGKNNQVIMEEKDGKMIPIKQAGNEDNAKLLSSFVEHLIYNNRYPNSDDITGNPLNAVKNLINGYILGPVGAPLLKPSVTSKSMIKTIDALNRANQMKTLGLGPIYGAVNLFGANIQAIAQRNNYYSLGEFANAEFRMNRLFQWTEKEGSKFMGLVNLFNPFLENENHELYRKAGSTVIKRISFDNFLMVFMRRGELKVQSANFEAILHNMMMVDGKIVNITDFINNKYKDRYKTPSTLSDVERKMKEEIKELKQSSSLYNSAKVNEKGELSIPGLDLNNKEEIRKLSILSKTLYKRITGNASGTSVNWMQLGIFSKSIMVFRNWIPKLWYTRFGELESKSDPFNRDAYEIGIVKVFFTAMTMNINDRIGAVRDMIKANERGVEALDAMYSKYADDYYKSTGREFSMPKEQFYDMIRQKLRNQVREIQTLLALLSAAIALGFVKPPDDDKRQKAGLAAIKQTMDKFRNELTFFYVPTNFQDVFSGGIFPSMSLLNDIEKFTSNLLSETTGINLYKLYEDPTLVRKEAHPTKYFLKLFPGTSAWLQFTSVISPELAKELAINPPSSNARR
jgi:hypothetical protein